MTCFRPQKAYRAPGGGITFSRKAGYVDRPVELPCGKCNGCRLARSRQWALRCIHESKLHEANCFVTLTYSNDHLPKDLSIDVEHWKKFAKRLRQWLARRALKASSEPPKFRYLHCGEYGDRTHRPHYHGCLFGVDFQHDRQLVKAHGDYRTYTSETLTGLWGMGSCTIGHLTEESAAYVARYVLKKHTGSGDQEQYRRAEIDPTTGEFREWFVKPPYITMSRRPGLGTGWIKEFHKDVYPSDQVVEKGFSHRPPRFYDDFMEKSDPEYIEGIKRKRREKVNPDDHTPEKRAAKEQIATARLQQKNRPL